MPEPGGTRFGRAQAWQTVRILGACALAFAASALIGLPERFWSMITAVVVTQPALDSTLSAGRDRIAGTLIGAAAAACVILAARHGAPSHVLFWVALVPLAVLTAVWPNLRLCCVTLIVAVLVPGSGNSFSRPLDRVVEIVLGVLAAVLVSELVPTSRKQ